MVTRLCPICGKEIIHKTKESAYVCRKKNCRSCSGKINASKQDISGEKNPFYGKKHSDKTRQQMAENHADFNGDKNPFKKSLDNPDNLKAHKKRCKENWSKLTENERKIRGSKSSLGNAKSSKNKDTKLHRKHKSGHYQTSSGKSYFYRSSWEKTALEYLDKLFVDKKISNFELEPYCIKYFYQGYQYALRVDFLVTLNDGNQVLLECKPIGLRTYGRNPIKIAAYIDYCILNNISFCLFGKDELKTIEDFWNVIIKSNS